MAEREFDKISVQDITEAATINRVTFYDHYTDKFALLQCMVGSRFQSLLDRRKVRYDAGCTAALSGIIVCVCDYLAEAPGNCGGQARVMEPHMESAVIAVVRRFIMEGFERYRQEGEIPNVPVEMVAATISWAIFGAAQEWVRVPNRPSSDEIASTIVALVEPIFSVLEKKQLS